MLSSFFGPLHGGRRHRRYRGGNAVARCRGKGVRSQHLKALILFLAPDLQLDGEFAKLLIVALQKIADQRDQGGAQDDCQAESDLHLILTEFHWIDSRRSGE